MCTRRKMFAIALSPLVIPGTLAPVVPGISKPVAHSGAFGRAEQVADRQGATSGPVTTASTATCSYGSCTELDPQAAGCASDAITLKTIDLSYWGGTHADLRYSATCHAAWIRTTDTRGSPAKGDVYGEVWDNREWIARCAMSTPGYAAYTTQWSMMCGGYPQYDIWATT